MYTSRFLACTALATLLLAGCSNGSLPASPTPPVEAVTANAYILPGAIDMGMNAFGDEPVVIHQGERLRWLNVDTVEHDVTADTPALPEFETTGPLAPGDQRTFVIHSVGTTRIHCMIHPQMTGTLIVR